MSNEKDTQPLLYLNYDKEDSAAPCVSKRIKQTALLTTTMNEKVVTELTIGFKRNSKRTY